MRKVILATVFITALMAAQASTAIAQATEIHAEITSATLLDPAHILVEGTVTCDEPAEAEAVSVTLKQRGGGVRFIEGFGTVFQIPCDTTPTSFSLVVGGGPFHAGRAIFDMVAFSCDPATGECIQENSFGIIRIRQG